MNKRLCACILFPLIAVVVVSIAYYGFVVYFAAEQHIACSLTQATNIPYATIISISLLFSFILALVISIIKMCHCTLFCLHTTYVAWQEHNSKKKNDPAE
jgi:hypothetical protein